MLTVYQWAMGIGVLVAAFFSVWVYLKYRVKEKEIEESHAEIRKTLAGFETSAIQLVALVDKLMEILGKLDPESGQKIEGALAEMKIEMSQMGEKVRNKVRSMVAHEAKEEYAIERAIGDQLDELITEDALEAYSGTDDNLAMKFLVPLVAEYPQFRPFIVKYAMGRVAAIREQGVASAVGKTAQRARPLDR